MLTVSSITNLPASPAVALPSQPVTQQDRSSAVRLTPVAVSAPLPDERISSYNQQTQSSIPPASDQTGNNARQGGGNSASYVAQVLSQSSEPVDSVSFGRFAPALQYNTLVGYGFVKYKPSNAGLTSGRGSDTSQQVLSNEPLNPVSQSVSQAYSNTQSRNQAQLDGDRVAVLIAG